MRRWQQKPQQQIYRPGSGPLRKSGQSEEQDQDTNSLNQSKQNIQDKLKRNEDIHSSRQSFNFENDNMSDQKRQRKPEQQIYVPKPMMAQAMADRESFRRTQQNKQDNWNNRNDRPKSSRCFTRNEYHNGNVHDRLNVGKNYDNRELRQGSEPRNTRPHTVHSERVRDTRSVEPSGNSSNRNDKIQSKPPSGRRHSTVGVEDKPPKNLDNLPPRFRKQYLANSNRLESNNPITPVPEDNWDGTSLTFKNCGNNIAYSSNNFHLANRQTGPVPSYYTNYAPVRQNMPPMNWSNTVPAPRYRGRGRLRQDMYDNYNMNNSGMQSRSPTFSNNSRPSTPLQNLSNNENVSQPNSRCQTPVEYQRPVSSGYKVNSPVMDVKSDVPEIPKPVEPVHQNRVLHDDPDEILVGFFLIISIF